MCTRQLPQHLVRVEEGVEADGGQVVRPQSDLLSGLLHVHDLVQLVRVLQLWERNPTGQKHTIRTPTVLKK